MIWDSHIIYCKHGSGPYHGKDKNPATKERRKRSYIRMLERKDRNVFKSSNGCFKTVSEFEEHKRSVS